MGRAKKLIELLKTFDKWGIGGHKTQKTSTVSENFVKECIEKVYADIEVVHLGSQQHPDFVVMPKGIFESVENFRVSEKKDKITKDLIKDWEKSAFNKKAIRIARVEVKTGESVYTLNDTFPEPRRELDEIYVLFSLGEKKIFVTTSATLAENCKCSPPISERSDKSKNIIVSFQKKLFNLWNGTGVTTAARPTYRINKEYAHHDASPESISEVFRRAGIHD